jgi:hypothetical protein
MHPIIRPLLSLLVLGGTLIQGASAQTALDPRAPAAPASPAAPAAATPTPGTSPAAAPINEKQLADLLKALQDLETQLGSAKGKATISALTAFQAAMANDDRAYSLFMDCTKKIEFDDKGKTGGEYGEWKRRDEVKALHEPEHTTVLRLQLHWLVLSIQATNATTDTAFSAVVAQVPAYLDTLEAAWKKMKTFRKELNKDVLSTVYAQYFKLEQIMERREGWSYNPLRIDSIYDEVVLPYLRKQKNAASLTASWRKRIQMLQDNLEIEIREGKDRPGSRAEENGINFKTVKLPRLEWGMMKDNFVLGGATVAGPAMLNHIRLNLGHRDAPVWIEELKSLAKGEEVEPTVVGDNTLGDEPSAQQDGRNRQNRNTR